MKHRTVSATEFKAKCLAIFNEIDEQGGTVTVTKRGRPVATVSPAKKKPFKSPEGSLAGKVQIIGDLVDFNMADMWNVVREREGKP